MWSNNNSTSPSKTEEGSAPAGGKTGSSHGIGEAMSSVSSVISQDTKDYLYNAKQQVFDNDKLRSISVFFGIGEANAFSFVWNPSTILERGRHNILFFYLNYILLYAIIFVVAALALLISPVALIIIGCLVFSWLAVIHITRDGQFQVIGITVTRKQASLFMMVVSLLLLLWVLKPIFWVTLCSTSLLALAHVLLRDASQHTLEEKEEKSDGFVMVEE